MNNLYSFYNQYLRMPTHEIRPKVSLCGTWTFKSFNPYFKAQVAAQLETFENTVFSEFHFPVQANAAGILTIINGEEVKQFKVEESGITSNGFHSFAVSSVIAENTAEAGLGERYQTDPKDNPHNQIYLMAIYIGKLFKLQRVRLGQGEQHE